jgi:hypothetical protein
MNRSNTFTCDTINPLIQCRLRINDFPAAKFDEIARLQKVANHGFSYVLVSDLMDKVMSLRQPIRLIYVWQNAQLLGCLRWLVPWGRDFFQGDIFPAFIYTDRDRVLTPDDYLALQCFL